MDVKQHDPSHDQGQSPVVAAGGEAPPPAVISNQGQASSSNQDGARDSGGNEQKGVVPKASKASTRSKCPKAGGKKGSQEISKMLRC